ncbi:MAG: hypothetical protein SGPRY_011168, partial [Prymnesium sp.]
SGRAKDVTNSQLLIDAASAGDMSQVLDLLNRGTDPDSTNGYQSTPLMSASWEGHLAVVQLLVEHGAQVDLQDAGGDYALLFAAFHGSNDIVDALCEAGADSNIQNSSGHTALMIAVVRMSNALPSPCDALNPAELSPYCAEFTCCTYGGKAFAVRCIAHGEESSRKERLSNCMRKEKE